MTNKKVVQLAADIASYMTGSSLENHERILSLVEAVRQDTLNELGKSGRYGYTAIEHVIETGMTLDETWYFLRGMIIERDQRNNGTATRHMPTR